MKIHLLHTNDVHSQLENFMRLGASLRRFRHSLREAGESVLTVDVGDVMDRVRPETEASFGHVNAAMMAALGYDAWVFGNNEGLTLPVREWPSVVQRSGAPVLCANLYQPDGRRVDCFRSMRWFDRGGVRVGVFGVTPNYESTYRAIGVEARDPFREAADAVARLREAGCQIVVALSHLGLGADRRLAAEVAGIDVILGGHTHHFMQAAEFVHGTAVFQAGRNALAYGHTMIEYDDRSGRVVCVTSRLVGVDPSEPYDAQMLSAYRGYLPDVEQRLSEPVVRLNERLAVDFERESPFANVLADALYETYPADLCMVMTGALTASLLPGQVEVRHILAACSTPTRPLMMTLTGREIQSVIEKSLRPEFYERIGIGFGFRGAVVGFMALAGAEAHVCGHADGTLRLHSVRVAGQPLSPDRQYRVVTCEYLWLAPVFEEFRRGRDIEFGASLVREVLMERMADPRILQRARQPRYVRASGCPSGPAVRTSNNSV
ncbi:MAG: bifunctional metallophosphatase/5'-nucleotidase [Alicyclobacillaceae bacterium]|nr:bifunctional metallophosphatase/5'-nucleotidase [Alicyclobacillaceae bacterium]